MKIVVGRDLGLEREDMELSEAGNGDSGLRRSCCSRVPPIPEELLVLRDGSVAPAIAKRDIVKTVGIDDSEDLRR